MFIQVYRHTDRPPRTKGKHARFYLTGKKPVHVQDVARNTIAYDKILRNIEFRQVNVYLHKTSFCCFKSSKICLARLTILKIEYLFPNMEIV